MQNKLGHWIARWIARLLLARLRLVTGLALLVMLAAALIASRLQLDTDFAALLPEDAPEIAEINRVRDRVGGQVELIVAVEGKEQARLRFATALVAALRRDASIRRADVEFPVDFILDRRFHLMAVEDLARLQRALEEEIQRVKARTNPFFVDLEDDAAVKPWQDVDQMASLGESAGLLKRYFVSPDGRYLFVRVLPKGSISNMEAGRRLMRRIEAVVGGVNPGRYGVKVRYAGGLPLNQQQHRRMTDDLRRASLIALVLVLLLLTAYIRRFEAALVLVIPLVAGLSVTFAITHLTFGHLNLVSGFLVTALIGLGIDFEIHLYLRYLEKLPTASSEKEAMAEAIEGTFPGRLTAGMTTAVAFFAMTFARFRGFSEYGAIAAIGVLATLVMTYLTLPALALMLTRGGAARRRTRLFPVRPLAGRLALVMVLVAMALSAFAMSRVQRVRYRNDFKQLRGHSAAVDFSDYVDRAFGGSLAPAAIFVDDLRQARTVEQRLKRLKGHPSSGVQRYLSLASLLPDDAPPRRALLTRMEQSLLALPADELEADDRRHVDQALRRIRMPSWDISDIPEAYRQQFLTLDGKGTLILVWPRYSMHEDAEVIAWGDELTALQRELRAAGISATILDENRIAARVLRQMKEDAPRVLAYAGLAVLLILALDFRRWRPVLFIGGALALGIIWFLGFVQHFGFEINVFNQAVIPSLLGLGLDNAVHLQHRYTAEGRGSMPLVVATTGSASLLASVTTAIGFGAAITAYHYGVQSMGWLAIMGFCCTFLATTIVFPALLRLLEGRSGSGAELQPGRQPVRAASRK